MIKYTSADNMNFQNPTQHHIAEMSLSTTSNVDGTESTQPLEPLTLLGDPAGLLDLLEQWEMDWVDGADTLSWF